MIIKLKKDVDEKVILEIKEKIEELGLTVVENTSKEEIILGAIGNTKVIDIEKIKNLDGVIDVCVVKEAYKRASRKFHPEDTVIKIGDEVIIGNCWSLFCRK